MRLGTMRNSLRKKFSRLRSDESGNVLILTAAALLPMLALIGSAVDISMAYMGRGKLQNACDSAVLAGRQAMVGTFFTDKARAEANKFFEFNYDEGTLRAQDLNFQVERNARNVQELIGFASMNVPTSIMHIFGFESIPVSVSCDAMRDQAHNDIAVVLDVTGSMTYPASGGGGTKISLLRNGAKGLYRALANAPNSKTRFALIPYSQTVNAAGSLRTRDILREQAHVGCERLWYGGCRATIKKVHIDDSSWRRAGNTTAKRIDAFRNGGDGCVEERASSGQDDENSTIIYDEITAADIDLMARNDNDISRQFGRYDPGMQEVSAQAACPAPASRLQTYANESAFSNAVSAATARVTGGTYHDTGMIWGMRFLSRTGFFGADNPTKIDDIPVNQHIVFMTDGKLETSDGIYAAHGIERYQNRTRTRNGSKTLSQQHIARFLSACNVARSMGATIWVIALDVDSVNEIAPCATSEDHFYISNGSDLEEVFEQIGQGIGNLRLTR